MNRSNTKTNGHCTVVRPSLSGDGKFTESKWVNVIRTGGVVGNTGDHRWLG